MNVHERRPTSAMEQLQRPITMPRVGLGTWAIGGWMWGGTDEAESIRTIHAALDLGITLIDTAPVYGFGRSEEIVGKALAQDGRRRRAVIATKVGLDWKDAKPFRNGRPERIVKEVEDSLRRLRTDVIDLYQVHWPDPMVPLDDTAEAMARLYRAGKINAIGVSNFSPAEMDVFRTAAPLHTAQPPYNMFERGAEADVLPYCAAHGITTLPPTARYAAGSSPGACAPTPPLRATICAVAIRNSARRVLPSTCDGGRGARSPSRASASASG